MIAFKFFQDRQADYEALSYLDKAVWPEEWSTADEWRAFIQNRPTKYVDERYLVEDTGDLVAMLWFFEPPFTYEAGKIRFELRFHPDFKSTDGYQLLYSFMLKKLAQYKLKKLQAAAREGRDDWIAFLEGHSFRVTGREQVSQLDVTQFDPAKFAGAEARLTAKSIHIRSLAALMASDPDCLTKLFDMHWETGLDVPRFEEDVPVKMSFEVWKQEFMGKVVSAETIFIAVNPANDYLGMTALYPRQSDTSVADTGYTGVYRAWRRHGIAKALKIHAITHAKQSGIDSIHTDNDENNPMLLLNYQLGFQNEPAWLDYQKDLY